MSETLAHALDTRYRTGDVEISENVDFDGLFLSKTILQGLNRAGFVRPSPIQLKAIPIGRCGLDLIVQAKSGTGKTCVFTVVALEGIIPENNRVQALILAPTREIAFQNAHVVQSIGSSIQKLRSYAFTGGIPLAQDKLKLKCCHVATGTPGRIKQLIEEGTMITDSIRLFVLDEADKLLEEGFQDTINWIYAHLPENKQIIAASATYTEDLAQFLMRYMRNPTFVRLNSNDPALLGVKQYFKVTPFHTFLQKVFDEKIAELLKLLNKISFNQCIIFSNYQARAQLLCDLLTSKGWPTMYISGSQDQQQRMHVMSTLHKFQCRILISTDLTSRGIDAEHVNLVLNLDVPWDKETYLHRIGRAGRFGTVGIAVTFASQGKEEELLLKIKNDIGLQLIPLPDHIDNTIWQLGPTKAPLAKEEITNPFDRAPSTSSINVEEEPKLQSSEPRKSKRDSVMSRSSNDSSSTDQSIHTVISRCQSTGDEEVIQIEHETPEESQTPLPSVISRCESTDDVVEIEKTQAASTDDVVEIEKTQAAEEEYVPTSVKNRIHEFERYIVKLINSGDAVKQDAPTQPELPLKRPMLKELHDTPTVKSNTSSEVDDASKFDQTKTINGVQDKEMPKKSMVRAATIDIPSSKVNPILQRVQSECTDVIIERKIVELKLDEYEKPHLNIDTEKPVVTRSYEELLSDLEDFIDHNLGHGDVVTEDKTGTLRDNDKFQRKESGDDGSQISQYAKECLEKMESFEIKSMEDIPDDLKSYKDGWDCFKNEIQGLDLQQVDEKLPVNIDKSDQIRGLDLQPVEEKPSVSVVPPEIIEPEDIVTIENDVPNTQDVELIDEPIKTDIVDRVVLLSKITSEHEWIFSSSSIEAPESEKDANESCETDLKSASFDSSATSENEEKEASSNDAKECILGEEEASVTESELTEEETSDDTTEESESSDTKEETATTTTTEQLPTEETVPEMNQWTEYWKSFSDWAAQMHKPCPSTGESTRPQSVDQHYGNMMPPFPFPMPPFPSQMPSCNTPQHMPMPSMWPQFQSVYPPYPSVPSFNSCCNCSMNAWTQYWSFCQFQMMMMMQKCHEKKE